MSLSPEAVLATFLAFLAGIGATLAGIAGVIAAARLRVPAGGDRSTLALSTAQALADSAGAALAGAGAFVCGGALIDAAMWAAYQFPTYLFIAGACVIVIGPIACVLAARRSRALTRTAALVMQYELGFPAGLRDHDAALESALAAEPNSERALRRYAAARERVLRRMRPRPR